MCKIRRSTKNKLDWADLEWLKWTRQLDLIGLHCPALLEIKNHDEREINNIGEGMTLKKRFSSVKDLGYQLW